MDNKIAIAGKYLGGQLQVLMEDEEVGQAKEVIRMVALKRWELAHPVTVVTAEVQNESSSDPEASQSQQQHSEIGNPPVPAMTPMQKFLFEAKQKKSQAEAAKAAKEAQEKLKIALENDPNKEKAELINELNMEMKQMRKK